METKRRLRFGVIGSGDFAQVCHIPGIQAHPNAEVVALCASDSERGKAIAQRCGIADVYTDYRELCARPDIDGVTICTANVFHAEQALCALAQGKHVLCEKPLAMNVTEAARMTEAAVRSGKVHQVAFTFRYGYALRELRRRVQSGDIGRPYYLRVQYDGWRGLQPDWRAGWQENRSLAGGGELYSLGVHLFDAARFVLGPIECVTGFVENFPRMTPHVHTDEPTAVETDDVAAAWFRHGNGARGQWFISRASPSFTDNGYLEVIGWEGALKASLSRGKLDVLRVSRPAQPAWEELPLAPESRDGKPHSLGLMMRSFVDACLRGRPDTSVDASFEDGLAAQRGLAAVLAANQRDAWIRLDDL